MEAPLPDPWSLPPPSSTRSMSPQTRDALTAIVTCCRKCGQEFEPDHAAIVAGRWCACPACQPSVRTSARQHQPSVKDAAGSCAPALGLSATRVSPEEADCEYDHA